MPILVHTHCSLVIDLLLLAQVVLLVLLAVLGAPNPLLKEVDYHSHLRPLVQNLRQSPSLFPVQPSERHTVVTKDYGGNSVNQKRFQEASAPSSWRPREGIETPHGFVTSRDGTRLFYRFQEPTEESSPDDKVVLVLHGIAWHSAPYLEVFAHFLVPSGVTVYAMDFRGHGLSGGRPGDLGNPTAVMDDIDAMLQFLRAEYPERQLFLAGESMGGLFALAYVAEYQPEISGLILIAPGLSPHSRQILHPETFLSIPKAIWQPDEGTIDLLGWRMAIASRGTKFLEMRRADELALSKVSLKYLLVLARINALWEIRYPSQVRVPTLILQGLQDKALAPEGAKKLLRLLATQDKALEVFPGLNHTLLWDDETPVVFEKILRWLNDH